MGKCISKEKNQKKEVIVRNRREESICTPIQSEGARNVVYAGPRPVLLKNMDNVETQVDSSLQKSGRISHRSSHENSMKKPVHSRNPSKISIDFDQLSKLKIEQEMLLRIGKSLHELGRCYQCLDNYTNSVELLQLAGEIYMHLSLYPEFNLATADLLLAYIANENLQRKMPIVIEPLDERTSLICSTFKFLNGQGKDPIVAKYGVKDFQSLKKVAKELDTSRLGNSYIVDALLDLGHLFRIWLMSPAESLNLYEEGEFIDPDNHEIYFYKGLSYRALGSIELAIDSYVQGINKRSNFADCYFNLGNIYLEEKQDFKEAEACYLNALFACENGYQGLVSVGKICSMLAEVYFFQECLEKALDVLFKGIGADFLYIENFNKASRFARLLEFDNLSSLLGVIGMIFNDQPFGDLPESIEASAVAYKNVLFGSIGEILTFVKKMPTPDKLSKSERIAVKKSFNKITPEQVQKLIEFYVYLEKL